MKMEKLKELLQTLLHMPADEGCEMENKRKQTEDWFDLMYRTQEFDEIERYANALEVAKNDPKKMLQFRMHLQAMDLIITETKNIINL